MKTEEKYFVPMQSRHSFQFFDKHGQQCDFESNPRIIGISLGQLANVPLTLAIAGGEHKAEAILGALRGGYLNGLITDESAVKR